MTIILAFIMMAVMIAADQWIKLWALNSLTQVDTIPLIQNVLHFTYVENRGAAFGIMQGKVNILLIVTGIFLAGMLIAVLAKKIEGNFRIWSYCLVIAGGIGNLIDRAFRGFVVDYIDFRLIDFPVFNLADCCVCVGVFALLLYEFFIEPAIAKKKGETQSSEQ